MIKINLLPKKEVKVYPIFLFLFFIILFLNLSALTFIYMKGKNEILFYERRIEEKKAEILKLEPIYKDYLSLEKEKKEIAKKIEIIDRISEGRTLPAKILYDIPKSMKETVWLKYMKAGRGKMEIEGFSFQNEHISDFAEALSKLPYMKNVELRNVQEVQESGFSVKKFRIEAILEL